MGFYSKVAVGAIFALVGCASANNATNATQGTRADVFNLGVVEVSAAAINKVGSVARVGSEEMRRESINDVVEAAKFIPGVHIHASGGSRNENMITVRGFKSTHVPVYVDGVPVYFPYDGNIDLSRFLASSYSQIDISKGASSLLYGPNSLGGVVNLITKKPSKLFEAELHYGLKYSPQTPQGEAGKKAFDQTADVRIGSKLEKVYVQVEGSYRNAYNHRLGAGHQVSIDPSHSNERRDKRVAAKVGFTPNETDEYVLSYSRQEGEKTARFYSGDNPFYEGTRQWYWPQWSKEGIYFHSHTQFNDAVYLKSRMYYDKLINELRNMKQNGRFETVASGGQGWVSYYDDYSWGIGLELGAKLTDRDELKIAPSIKNDIHRSQQLYPNRPSSNEPWQRITSRTFSLALEETFTPDDYTRIIFGASYNRFHGVVAQGYGESEWNTKGTDELFDFPLKDDSSFNYQLIAERSFNGNDALYASISKKTFFPTLKDRYSSRFGRYMQNPELEPETATNFELGYRGDYDRVNYEVALFYTNWDDKIEGVEVTSASGATLMQNQNVGSAKMFGVEVGLNAQIHDKIKIGGTYTYMHTELDSTTGDLYMTNLPRHKFSAYADVKLVPSLHLIATQYAQSGSYADAEGAYKTHGFGVTNVKLSYDHTRQLNFELGVENLWDKLYAYNEGYYEPGRTIRLDVRYRY